MLLARNHTLLLNAVSLLTSAPFITLAVLVYLLATSDISVNEFVFSILFLVLLPLLILFGWSVRKGIEWDYPVRRERIPPLLLVTFCYTIGFSLSLYLGLCFSLILKYIYLSHIVTGTVVLVFTLYYKISIHVAGIVAPATVFYWVNEQLLSTLLFLLAIIVGYMRVKLGRHTVDQVLTAYITTFTVNSLIYITLDSILGI